MTDVNIFSAMRGMINMLDLEVLACQQLQNLTENYNDQESLRLIIANLSEARDRLKEFSGI